PVLAQLVPKLVVQLAKYPPPAGHRVIEVSETSQLRASRRRGVPARGEMIGERVKMRAKDSRSEPPKRVAAFDELIQHVSSVPGSEPQRRRQPDYADLASAKLIVTAAKGTISRWNPA